MLTRLSMLSEAELEFISSRMDDLAAALIKPEHRLPYYRDLLVEAIGHAYMEILHHGQGGAMAYCKISPLELATRILGVSTWSIDWLAYDHEPALSGMIRQVLTYLKEEKKAQLIICKSSDACLVQELEKQGFFSQGENQAFQINTSPVKNLPLPAHISRVPALTSFEKHIADLVRKTYEDGHYFSDPKIPKAKAKDLMTEIILGLYARHPENFAVFFKNDTLLGFAVIEILDVVNQFSAVPYAQTQFTVFDLDWEDKIFFPAIYAAKYDFFSARHPGPMVAEIHMKNKRALKLMPTQHTLPLTKTHLLHGWI